MISFPQLGHLGRLGNQMFQYALLVGVAERHGYDIVIPNDVLEGFRLSSHRLPRNSIPSPTHVFNESVPAWSFDSQALEQPDGTGFNGYFQSHRYFEHASTRVRDEFRFSLEIEYKSQCWIEQISQRATERPVIAMHVRRGDYLQSPNYHCAFDLNYFHSARRAMDIDGALLVILSDDLPWVHMNLSQIDNLDSFILSDPDPMICLCVVSRSCQHTICSASSLSWWAAWLNASTDARVVIPDRWYGSEFGSPETENQMSPPAWIRA